MGFLRKVVKKVKKGVKKVVKGVKKVFKKITSSKALKTIALIGAAIVTGGAFVGAYGGTLASSTVGSWLASTSAKILATPVVGTLATPFQMLGTAAGTGAGKVTDFLGFTSEAGRLNLDKIAFDPVNKGYLNIETGQPLTPTEGANLPSSFKDTAQVSGSYLDSSGKIVRAGDKVATDVATDSTGFWSSGTGKFISQVGGNVAGGVATGYLMNEITEEDPVGAYGAGLGEERGLDLTPLEIAYSQANIDINDAYKNLTYGNADASFLYNTSEFAKSPMIGVA